MRQLKFRAFSEVEKRFYYFTIGQGSSVFKLNAIYDELCLNGVHFEQFTGLKDKNDNDVYEGDIVNWLVNDRVLCGIVDYPESFGGYDLKHLDDNHHVCNDWLRGEYEITGNIHVNPELLK
jgi:uncharacterized phage protein (TIGR01671 family)